MIRGKRGSLKPPLSKSASVGPRRDERGAYGIVKANKSNRRAKNTILTTLRAAASFGDEVVERSFMELASEDAMLTDRLRVRRGQNEAGEVEPAEVVKGRTRRSEHFALVGKVEGCRSFMLTVLAQKEEIQSGRA